MSGARHRTAYKFHAKMNKMVTVGREEINSRRRRIEVVEVSKDIQISVNSFGQNRKA